MTEEKADLTSEKFFVSIMPEGDVRLLIPGGDSTSSLPESDFTATGLEDTEPKISQARRNSTGSPDIPFTRVKILSRYLAASTGSCHDYCKYGTKQAIETKPWSPSFDKISEAGQDTPKASRFAESKNILVAGSMPILDTESQKLDGLVETKRESSLLTSRKITTSRRLSSSPRRATVFADQSVSRKPEAKSRNSEGKMASSQDKEIVSQQATIHLSAAPLPKKTVRKPIITSSQKQSTKVLSHTRSENVKSHKPGAEQSVLEEAMEKTMPAIEKTFVEKPAGQKKKGEESTGSLTSFREKSYENARKGKSSARLASLSAEILRRTRKETLATRSPSSASSKTLIHAEGESPASRPSRSRKPSNASPKPATGAILKRDGINKPADPQANTRSGTGKGGVRSAVGETSPVRKLTFTAGKKGELQSDIHTSRKLSGRQDAPGHSQHIELDNLHGTLKPAEVEEVEADGTKDEQEKVALRHQDVKEKTAVQSLLNNMIEATASKLAEENKSKVQALVGAFETVISLQDPKKAPS